MWKDKNVERELTTAVPSFQLKQNLTWPSLSLGGSCFSYDSAQSKVTNFMQCSLSIWILTSESWFCQNKYVDSEFEVQVGCVGQYGRPFDVVRLTRALAACLPSKRSSITEDFHWRCSRRNEKEFRRKFKKIRKKSGKFTRVPAGCLQKDHQ